MNNLKPPLNIQRDNIEYTAKTTPRGHSIMFSDKCLKRFFSFVKKDSISGCWEWIGTKTRGDYGNFSVYSFCRKEYVMMRAHIWSFLNFKHIFTYGNIVRHTCDNPSCVNPEHLIEGTALENSQDATLRNRDARGFKSIPKNCKVTTEEDVYNIRHLSKLGFKQLWVSELTGIGKHTVNRVILRRTWSWLEDKI